VRTTPFRQCDTNVTDFSGPSTSLARLFRPWEVLRSLTRSEIGQTRASRNWRLTSLSGQTAKNSRKALTSELPPVPDMVRPRGECHEALRGAFWSDRFRLFEKKRRGAGRDCAPQPQRRCGMVEGRIGMVGARPRVNRRRPMSARQGERTERAAAMRGLEPEVL